MNDTKPNLKFINRDMMKYIAVIVMFLLDIAARKFKWKWPHEIVRERKEKSLSSKKQERKGE